MISRAALAVLAVSIAGQSALAASTTPIPAIAVTDTKSETSDCGGTHELDRCMVGNWEMTVDGATEFARKQLKGVTVQMTSHVGERFVLNGDGTFATGVVKTNVKVDKADAHGAGQFVTQSSGRWTAAAGKLNFCSVKTQMQGSTTMTIGGRKVTVPVKPNTPSSSSQDYACAGDSLTTTVHTAKSGDIVSKFKRVP